MSRHFHATAFTIGFMLLLVNIVGSLSTLRGRDVHFEGKPGTLGSLPAGVVLTEKQLYDVINSSDIVDDNYLVKLTRAIHGGIAHYWSDDGIDEYHLRVPFSENYLLYLASFIYPSVFLKYEFTDYQRAIERGVGLCSQQAIIQSEILNEKGYAASIVQLSGHVVVQVSLNFGKDQTWILDPDYGVSIPHSLREIEANPELIRQFYAAEGYDDARINFLISIFDEEGNLVLKENGAKAYAYKAWMVERLAYLLIWAIPLFLMIPWVLSRIQRPRRLGS